MDDIRLFYVIRVKAEKPIPGDANWQGSAEVQPLNPAVVTPRNRWRNVSCWMTAVTFACFLLLGSSKSSSFDWVWKDEIKSCGFMWSFSIRSFPEAVWLNVRDTDG